MFSSPSTRLTRCRACIRLLSAIREPLSCATCTCATAATAGIGTNIPTIELRIPSPSLQLSVGQLNPTVIGSLASRSQFRNPRFIDQLSMHYNKEIRKRRIVAYTRTSKYILGLCSRSCPLVQRDCSIFRWSKWSAAQWALICLNLWQRHVARFEKCASSRNCSACGSRSPREPLLWMKSRWFTFSFGSGLCIPRGLQIAMQNI